MNIKYHQRYAKHYTKRIKPYPQLVKKLQQRVILFFENSQYPLLKDHQLTGDKKEYRSFSVTGDIRVIYKKDGDDVLFYDVGSHNQVY